MWPKRWAIVLENNHVEELLIELSLRNSEDFGGMCWLGSGGVEKGIPGRRLVGEERAWACCTRGGGVGKARSCLTKETPWRGVRSNFRKLNCGQIIDALKSQGKEFGGDAVRSNCRFMFVLIGSRVLTVERCGSFFDDWYDGSQRWAHQLVRRLL